MASRPGASPSQECETAAADEAAPQIQVMSMSVRASLSTCVQSQHSYGSQDTPPGKPCTGGSMTAPWHGGNKNFASQDSLGDAHMKLGPETHGTN